jgi:hypothetical protein
MYPQISRKIQQLTQIMITIKAKTQTAAIILFKLHVKNNSSLTTHWSRVKHWKRHRDSTLLPVTTLLKFRMKAI